jgi:autotransporter-associated beta strand protein
MKPMNHKPNYHALASGLGMILISCFIQQTLQADSLIWGGQSATSANWSDVLNWTNSVNANAVPNNGDSLAFPWTVQTTSSNDIAGLTVGSLTYSNASFDLVGNPLTITGGITNTAVAAGDNAFDLPLILGAAQTFEVDGGSLTLNKGITSGGNVLTFTGSGNVNLNGQVSGAGSLVMSGTGTLLITNRQPLTGGIVVNSGTLNMATPGNLNFGGAETPSLITVNAGGTVYNSTYHSIGGATAMFINGGIWELDHEDYKTNITMVDGTIQTGPSPGSNNGEVRVGFAGGGGTYTWYVTNSVAGSQINNPINTIGSPVNLILDVARGVAASDLTISGPITSSGNITVIRDGVTTLSGANTQTGTFTIAGGKVVLTSTLLSSVITVASNAVFEERAFHSAPARFWLV